MVYAKIGVTYANIAKEIGYSPQWLGKRIKKGLTMEEKESFELAACKLFNEMMASHGLRIRLKSNKTKEVQG